MIGSRSSKRPECRAARSMITRICLPTRQVRHRELVQYASDPELGEVPHIRTPVRIGDGVRVRTVAPKLGQHNAEIFGRLGLSAAEAARLRAKGVV
jgi:formyl-CoA transferase